MCSEVLRSLLLALDALGDRAGDEVDAQLARGRRAPTSPPGRRAARRRRAGRSPRPSTLHFSGSTTSARAVGRGARARGGPPSRGCEPCPAVAVSWTAAARSTGVGLSLPARLTDESIAREHSPHARRAALPRRRDRAAPRGSPLPPAPMPLPRGRRPLKRWRYVRRLRARADAVRGHGPRSPGSRRRSGRSGTARAGGCCERTRPAPRPASRCPTARVRVARPRGRRRSRARAAPASAVEVVSRHGALVHLDAQAPVRATGLVTLEGRTLAVDARGLIDETAGYHARHTAWEWSAGAGIAARRRARSCGTSSPACTTRRAAASARCGSTASRARSGPSRSPRASTPSASLRFAPEAERVRRDDLLLIASDYRQPFGTFAGTLPDGTELASGHGVMERHRARW